MQGTNVNFAVFFYKMRILQKKYNVDEDDIMMMYSAVYAGRSKIREEKLFYSEYIEKWLAEDKDRYVEVIRRMRGDIRRSILKRVMEVN